MPTSHNLADGEIHPSLAFQDIASALRADSRKGISVQIAARHLAHASPGVGVLY